MNPHNLDEHTHNCIWNNAKMVQYRLPKKVIDGKYYCEVDNLADIVENVIYRSIYGDCLDAKKMDEIINRCAEGVKHGISKEISAVK